jgi:hypothetical protein
LPLFWDMGGLRKTAVSYQLSAKPFRDGAVGFAAPSFYSGRRGLRNPGKAVVRDPIFLRAS